MTALRLRPSRLFELLETPRWNCVHCYPQRRGLANTSGSSLGRKPYSNLKAPPGDDAAPNPVETENTQAEQRIGYNPERMAHERSTLMELFSLSRIPDPRVGVGVKIDELGQLHVTNPVEARQKHQTALVFTAAPISLVERDFRKLLDTGKHIEGWRSDGGLEQVIPIRDLNTLRRKHGWVLLFSNPAAAQEYQARIHQLRVLLRHHLPLTSESKLQLPPAYTARGARGFTLQDYTISTPWLYPSVIAHLAPFNNHIRETINMHNNVSVEKDYSRQLYPVQISLDARQIPNISTWHIIQFMQWDGENRGTPWQLAEMYRPIARLTGESQHKIAAFTENKKTTTSEVHNWRVAFDSSSEARRFARAWHRRPLPKFTGLPYCDPPPTLHVECLFRDGGY